MPAQQSRLAEPSAALPGALARNLPWHRIAVVVAGTPDISSLKTIRELAIRDGAEILLYDIAASDGFTSPYPPGEDNWMPALLFEADLHRVGREDLAAVARDLAGDGLLAGVYLVPKPKAADLAALVQRERVDLVVSFLPAGDRRLKAVLEARSHAHVAIAAAVDKNWTLHAPLQASEILPSTDRIRLPYLLVLLATFLAARVRNRA